MRKTLYIAAVAIIGVSCGDSPDGLSTGSTSGPLTKKALRAAAPRAVVMATVTEGSAVSDVTVELSRSISGRVRNYAFSSTTGSDGTAEIEVVSSARRGVSGFYSARAVDSSGEIIGSWTSIPINGNLINHVTLTIGGRAVVTGKESLEPKTVFTVRIENVSPGYEFAASGAFATPVGADGPGPIGPGGAYEFSFTAAPGSALSFANMFVPSNDFFYGPGADGIALWDENGDQASGDVTEQIQLWDAGSEVNQEPGLGPDQVQRQGVANTGASDSDNTVRLATDDFNNLPATSDVISVTMTPTSSTGWTVRVENVSDGTTLSTSDGATQAVPMSPGVWVVHTASGPLFTAGEADRDEGLAVIAEDGDVSGLADALGSRTGLTVPQSPGIWVLHTDSDPIFSSGMADRGQGLEHIAEDGGPLTLADEIVGGAGIQATGAFDTPVGSGGPGPIGPGGAYEFSVAAAPGDRLSFVNMFVPSNDFFYGPNGEGIALWTSASMPVSGDVTSQISIWDAGTEVNQEPGTGLDQVQRQAAANTGAVDDDTTVRMAPDTFGNLPAVADIIRVTITAQ
jgi:hypothetical protein